MAAHEDAAPPAAAPPAAADRRRTPGRRRTDVTRFVDPSQPWWLVLTIGIGLALGQILFGVVTFVLAKTQNLLIAVVVSVFLSFAMEPAVQWLSRRGMRRGMATMLVFFIAILAFLGFFAAMAPLVIDQVTDFAEQGPEILEDLSERAESLPGQAGETVSEWLEEAPLQERLSSVTDRLAAGLLGFGTSVLARFFQGLIVLLVTFYLVADGPKLRRTVVRRLSPDRQQRLLALWELAIEKTGSYVYVRALVAIVSAAFHAIVFSLIGLEYSVAFGVWVGVVSSLIPVVGTYLAGGLPVVIALASKQPSDALWVLGAVIVYQQLENYLVAPRISAHTMKVHPAVAFLSVLAGAAMLGAVGALLALPTTAIIGGLVRSAGEQHEVTKHSLLGEDDAEIAEGTAQAPAT